MVLLVHVMLRHLVKLVACSWHIKSRKRHIHHVWHGTEGMEWIWTTKIGVHIAKLVYVVWIHLVYLSDLSWNLPKLLRYCKLRLIASVTSLSTTLEGARSCIILLHIIILIIDDFLNALRVLMDIIYIHRCNTYPRGVCCRCCSIHLLWRINILTLNLRSRLRCFFLSCWIIRLFQDTT